MIPRKKIPMGWELTSDIAAFYNRLGKPEKYQELIAEIEPQCLAAIDRREYSLNSYYNPVRVLLEIYDTRKDYQASIDLLRKVQTQNPGIQGVDDRVKALESMMRGTASQLPEKVDSTRKN